MSDEPTPRGLFAILAFCNFVVGLGAFSIIGMVEPLAKGLSVPVAAAASLLTVYSVGYAICSPVLVALTGASIYVGVACGSALGSVALHLGGFGVLGPAGAVVALLALGVLLWSHRVAQLRLR